MTATQHADTDSDMAVERIEDIRLKQILDETGPGEVALVTDSDLAAEVSDTGPTENACGPPEPDVIVRTPDSWRERLWMVPAETRLYTADVAEAVDRSPNWVHQRTSDSEDHDRIPHRKRNGQLVFKAGEVREWLKAQEEVIVAGSSTPSAAERNDFEVVGQDGGD